MNKLSVVFSLALLTTGTCLAQKIVFENVSTPNSAPSSGTSLPDAPSAQSNIASKGKQSTSTPIAAQPYDFPTSSSRSKAYLSDLIGPGAFFSVTVQAAIDQSHPLKVGYPSDGFNASGQHPAHGVVPEWSEGFDGFSKRYASRFGMNLVGTTSRYGLAEILHEDVSYHRCQCVGLLPRSYHALTQSFIAHTRSGRSVPSLPALVSPFIASEVATATWYPARYNASDALRTSTSLYYGLPIKNLVKEFGKH